MCGRRSATRPGRRSSSCCWSVHARSSSSPAAAGHPARGLAAPAGLKDVGLVVVTAKRHRRIYRVDPDGLARSAPISSASGERPWPITRRSSNKQPRRTNAAPTTQMTATRSATRSWWTRRSIERSACSPRTSALQAGVHNLLAVEIAETVFEPHVGGHLYDRGVDGSECRWARVLAYEPPDRVVISWDISPYWQLETDLEKTSEVEVRFVAETAKPHASRTRTPPSRPPRRGLAGPPRGC